MLRFALLLVAPGAFVFSCSSPAKPVTQPSPPADVKPDPAPVVEAPKPAPVEDPYLWLEEVTSDKSLQWARDRNATSKGELEGVGSFAASRDRIRGILDSKDKIPFVGKLGNHYYNFWTDANNKKGLLRRTTLAEYKKKDPKWELVIDIDALGEKEKTSWVFKGNQCLYPKYERCLMSLSKGGGDSTVVREWDMTKKAFVDGGFSLPEAKSRVSWKDKDTIYVGTDFGPGSMTKSGYPRTVREWKRGTKLTDAQQIFEGQETDVSVGAARDWEGGKPRDFVTRRPSFFTGETHIRDAAGKLTKLDVPNDAETDIWHDQILVELRTEWKLDTKTWPGGSLLAMPLTEFLAGKRTFTALFEPAPNRALASHAGFKSALVVNELEDVKNRLYVWTLKQGKWTRKPFDKAGNGTMSVSPIEPYSQGDDYWLTHTDFLTPSSLSIGALGGQAKLLKSTPAFFESKGLAVTQHFVKSKDGTRVPYFQVARESITLDGNNPTVLYGYGGFESSQTSRYSAISGAMWEERGGVYVVANIRGGGEYGPSWHQAGLRHNRQRVYDDFIAIAEDLVARKVTSPKKLGIVGGSNGGLLTGVMLTQRPDLFGAVISAVPLLDMKRYHKLLAGASWMEEYGDPEKADDWAVIKKYSPYQNVKPGVKYPRTLFTSSTRDDRVHPGHARKMVARMMEQGHDVLYYENIEGGHGGAADNEQAAFMQAIQWTFFAKQLGLQ
jgi:prolyl oligopeptidase